MTNRRIVVGALSGDDDLLAVARAMRDEGREIILVGAGQSAEQLVRAALAEDADELVVGANAADMEVLEAMCRELGGEHIRLTAIGQGGV